MSLSGAILLYPSIPAKAPFHGEGIYSSTDCAATAIFNVMELPATQVPLGLDSEGLPMGIQVVAAEGEDHRTIAIAMALEAAGVAKWCPPANPAFL